MPEGICPFLSRFAPESCHSVMVNRWMDVDCGLKRLLFIAVVQDIGILILFGRCSGLFHKKEEEEEKKQKIE